MGEEALADDEPIIIISHTDTREYASHMRTREALPENHDDIFNNIQEDNLGMTIYDRTRMNSLTNREIEQFDANLFEPAVDFINDELHGK